MSPPVANMWAPPEATRAPIRQIIVVIALFLSLLASSSASFARAPDAPRVSATALHPLDEAGDVRTDGRMPLLELYTATWCPVCAQVERALDRLLAEEERHDFALLSYHPWPDSEDPFGFPAGHYRMTRLYGATGLPTIAVDGAVQDLSVVPSLGVDVALEEAFYQRLDRALRQAGSVLPDFQLVTSWSLVDSVMTVRVEAKALVDGAAPSVMRVAWWDDHFFFNGSNGMDDHRMTVRELTPPTPMPELDLGEVYAATWTFVWPGIEPSADSGFVVIVENPPPTYDDDAPAGIMAWAMASAALMAGLVVVTGRKGGGRGAPDRAVEEKA